MAAVPEARVLASPNEVGVLQGQNGGVDRAALAYGVLWMRQIRGALVVVVGSLERLPCKGCTINDQTGFVFFVHYNVELLSQSHFYVLLALCAPLYGMYSQFFS